MTSRDEHWSIKKEISVGHILTTAIVALSVFWWASGIEQDVAHNADEIAHVKELDALQHESVESSFSDLKKFYHQIDLKLDKLIARELNGNHSD